MIKHEYFGMTYIIENEDNLLGLHHDTLLRILIIFELSFFIIFS